MSALNGCVSLEKATVFLLGLLVADTIIGGPIGLLFRGERHLILAILLIAGGGLIVYRWRYAEISSAHIQNRYFWPLSFFLLSLIWMLLVPTFTAGDISLALRDAQSLIMLPVATLLIIAISDLESAVKRLFMVVVIAAVCLALFQMSFWFWLEFMSIPTDEYYPILESVFNTSRSIFVGWQYAPSGGYVRVVWVSSIWLVIAIFVAPLVVDRKWLFLVELILGMAVYVSYTRGIWLGVVAGVLFCTIANHLRLAFGKHSSAPLKNWGVVIVALVFAVISISTLDYAARGQYGFLSRVVDFSSSSSSENGHLNGAEASLVIDASTSERRVQAGLLVEKWSDRPWMGWGYGAYIQNHFSDDLAPYSYEMLPFALLMKTGVVGFTIYLVFWASLVVYALKSSRSGYSILFTGGLSAFLLASHTNPFLFNFVGMSAVMFFLVWWASIKND